MSDRRRSSHRRSTTKSHIASNAEFSDSIQIQNASKTSRTRRPRNRNNATSSDATVS